MVEGEIATKAEQVFEARVRGWSAQRCAQHFGITPDEVHAIVERFRIPIEDERVRIEECALEIARIDELRGVVYTKAQENNLRAVEIWGLLGKYKAELMGLYSPRLVELREPEPAPNSGDKLLAALNDIALARRSAGQPELAGMSELAELQNDSADIPSAADDDKQLN